MVTTSTAIDMVMVITAMDMDMGIMVPQDTVLLTRQKPAKIRQILGPMPIYLCYFVCQ